MKFFSQRHTPLQVLLMLAAIASALCVIPKYQPARSCGLGCPDWFSQYCLPYGTWIDSDGNCYCGDTPIIIDLQGKGIRLSSPAEGVFFDLRANGTPRRYSWPESNTENAFLALDRNHNGLIDNGAELFGNVTSQPKGLKRNGFIALAEYDKPENGGNADGQIDAHDAIYSGLLLWIDQNRNGRSEPEELSTLDARGVTSISLGVKLDQRRDQYGNLFRFRSRIESAASGSAGPWAWDVLLQRDERW
jgi:hypothetical protein